MSRTFFGFSKIFNNCTGDDIIIKIPFFGLFLCGHATYSYGTQQKKLINVTKKYIYAQNACSEFMLVDSYGNHYNVNNSVWYWKWNSIEDWTNINENDKIQIKYYGYRIPFLGFFPNIIETRIEGVK
jgi:hypothetical protein